MWKELLTIVIVSVVSVVALFVLTKLMGNKQISQMSMFDYVIGISIGSIAAEMATELEQPAYPLLAMVVYALIAFGISVWSSKSLSFRKLTTGKPILLLDNGVIYRDNMKKARLDLSDFLTLCRAAGYFDLADIRTAIFEHNGTVSFLPMAEKRPVQERTSRCIQSSRAWQRTSSWTENSWTKTSKALDFPKCGSTRGFGNRV